MKFSEVYSKSYNLGHFLVDCKITSLSKLYILPSEADLKRSRASRNGISSAYWSKNWGFLFPNLQNPVLIYSLIQLKNFKLLKTIAAIPFREITYTGAQPEIFHGRGDFLELEHFDTLFVKNTKKKKEDHTGKNFGASSPRYS